MRRALVLVGLLTIGTGAASAQAATVSAISSAVSDDAGGRYMNEPETGTRVDVTFTAAPGDADDVRVSPQAGADVFEDTAGVQPGPGCTARSGTAVVCPAGTLGGTVAIALGDGDDRADVEGLLGTVDGGPGNDVLTGDATLLGGEGDDRLTGTVTMDGGPGADVMGGGGTVSYADRTAPVHVTPGAGGADDGEAGEGDEVLADVEQVVGGSGADDLELPADPRTGDPSLSGGPGNDRLVGGDGYDLLYGGPGDDVLVGGGGNDQLEGGPGADHLYGGDGDDQLRARDEAIFGATDVDGDVLDGGSGDDELDGVGGAQTIIPGPGRDVVGGGGGADQIDARDGQTDLITCEGGGAAALDADDLSRGCASVDRRGQPRAEPFLAGEDDFGRGYAAVIGCPQDAAGGCAVRLRIGSSRVVAGRLRTHLRAGSARVLALPLPGLGGIPSRAVGGDTPASCRYQPVLLTATTRVGTGRPRRSVFPVRLGSGSVSCPLDEVNRFESGWPAG